MNKTQRNQRKRKKKSDVRGERERALSRKQKTGKAETLPTIETNGQ